MNRRQLLATALASTLARPALAAEEGWQARILQGGFDGKVYLAGLHIMLMPGWKTYWRVPGEAGIPPQIKVSGENVEGFEVLAPLPTRITDGSGEAIGYHDEVVFMLRMAPKLIDQSLSAKVSAFFGVCEQICKPAKFEGSLTMQPGITESAPVLSAWQKKFPVAQDFMTQATADNGTLAISLRQAVDDIFIEGPDELYFRAPTFGDGKATIKIDGLQSGQSLQGVSLRCTAAMQGKGLEQVISVS